MAPQINIFRMNSTNTTDSDSAAATPPVAEEDDMVVASIPRSSSSSKGAASTTKMRKLSTVSRMYDIDGDGELDAAELAMRKMDSTNRGYLSNDKVYKIMQEQLETQKQLFRTRRVAFVLLALVVLLALSNLGTSFAAAHLAKDTTVTSTEALAHKQTGDTLSTQTTEDSVVVERAAIDSEGRRRLCGNGESGVECTVENSDLTLSKKDCKRMLKHCKRGNKVNGVQTWRTGDQTVTNICPNTGQQNKFGVSVLKNDIGETFELEEDDDGNCRISGDAFRQQQGFICDIDSDCVPGLSCAVRQDFVNRCKQRCEWKRWAPHKVGQCKTGCEHPSCQAADE